MSVKNIFKSRKRCDEEERKAVAAAAAQKKRGIKAKLSGIKVSDAVAGVGALAATTGAVFTTVGVIKSVTEKPAETAEEAAAGKILEWLLDMPAMKPDSPVWDLAWNSRYLKGARWDKKTTVCKMVEARWPEASAQQQAFIVEHTTKSKKKQECEQPQESRQKVRKSWKRK